MVTYETRLNRLRLLELTVHDLASRGLSQTAREAVSATFPPDRELVFPWKNSRASYYDHICSLLDHAGEIRERRFTFHEEDVL